MFSRLVSPAGYSSGVSMGRFSPVGTTPCMVDVPFCILGSVSITWGLPTIMYSFLHEPFRSEKELPPAGSWVDYLDPDYVLKVPYAHTAQEKS